MRHVLVIAVVVGIAASVQAQRVGQAPTLTADAIEQAIALGRDSDPSPYSLPVHGVTRDGNVVAGAELDRVYTPFLRVALASHRAARDRRNVSSIEVDPTLLEPLLYVAIRRYQTPAEAVDVRIFLGRQGSHPPSEVGIPPAWIREAGVVLRAFEDGSVTEAFHYVAAFPLDAVRPGLSIMVTSKRPGLDGVSFAQSLIRQQELDAWR